MLHQQSFAILREQYRDGSVSPLDVAGSALGHAERVNQQFNAFALLDGERTQRAATASAQRWREGRPLSAIDGMPFTVKEFAAVEGWPTRRGSVTTAAVPAASSSVFVARLEAAGAVLLGKTRAPEFNWKGVTDSPGYGITRNPWNTEWTPGGSSGGCSAAVAAGVVRVSIGSDAAGSVRIPAAFTGTIGFKAGFGRIPLVPFPSHFSNLAHTGPIGASIADINDTMHLLAGAAAGDWTSTAANARPWRTPAAGAARGLRIGLLNPRRWELAQTTVRQGMQRVVDALASEGFAIADVDFDVAAASEAGKSLYRLGCGIMVRDVDPSLHPSMDPGLLEYAYRTADLGLDDYLGWQRQRDNFAGQLGKIFEDIDVLLLPTVPILPFEAGRNVPPGWHDEDWLSWNPYTPAFNLLHNPALSYPIWVGDAPVGVQCVAPPLREDVLIAFGAWLEERFPVRLAPMA